MDCSQFKNLAIWKIYTDVDVNKPAIWQYTVPDVHQNRPEFLAYITKMYTQQKEKYDWLYLFDFVVETKVFSKVFGQYTKAEVLGRLYLSGISYFVSVHDFVANWGLPLLANTLFDFLDRNEQLFAQYYNPLQHNKPAIKHFLFNFLCAYRKPNSIIIGTRKSKNFKVNVICPKTEVPSDVTVFSEKNHSIGPNELGVGMLCWHSKGNLTRKMTVINPNSNVPTQKRKRCKNRPSKAQREKKRAKTCVVK